ncbi:MAG TPA: alpha/beta hydrolase [Chitinophagaceae bacterium]|nr:alpha/beta hydrolase [Chitinophagaceae bacterium]
MKKVSFCLSILLLVLLMWSSQSAAQSSKTIYYSSTTAPIQFAQVDTLNIAYKEMGTGVPIICLQRFRGTLNDWDPAFVDALAKKYRVILFDAPGLGLSSGTVPTSITTMADQAIAFARALGISRSNYLGWSMGGAIAQVLAINHPEQVIRLILAATGPSANPEFVAGNPEFGIKARKPIYSFEDNQFLFFYSSPSSKKACSEYLGRLESIKERDTVANVSAYNNMSTALASFKANNEKNYFELLKSIGHPVLVANGKYDPSYPFANSYVLAREIPNSKLIVYPDAGHGFLFQYYSEFALEVMNFLGQENNK